jgi:hypothetical protein
MGTRMSDKQVNYLHKLNKLNNKLVSVWLEHFWCMDEPRAYTDSQDSPFSMISHEGCIQMSFCLRIPKLGVPKFSKLELPTFWRVKI